MPGHNPRSITKLLICLGRIRVDYNDFSSSGTTIIISTVLVLAAAGWIPRFFRQTRNFFMVLYPLLLTKMWIAPKNVQACVTALLYTRTTLFSPYVTHCFKVETKYGKLHRYMKVSFSIPLCRILKKNLSRLNLPSFWTIITDASSASANVTQVFFRPHK